MKTLSLCMIVKNESKVLARCLESVKGVFDEIIIVDTFSTDKTVEIAKSYGARVFTTKWENDFSQARNFSFKMAESDYIMWLDADDVVSDENRTKLLGLKENLKGDEDVIMLKYDIAFDGNGKTTFSYYRERILKNDSTFIWQGAVHEVITPHGKIIYSDVSIAHKPLVKKERKFRNINIYRRILKNRELNAREQYYYSRELFYLGYYKKASQQLKKYLKMPEKWFEDEIAAREMLGDIWVRLNKHDLALNYYLSTFNCDAPRKSILCKIGDVYLAKTQNNQAIFFYETALNCQKYDGIGFNELIYDYQVPLLRLCYVYFQMGNIEKAVDYNNKLLMIEPQNEWALQNKSYFISVSADRS